MQVWTLCLCTVAFATLSWSFDIVPPLGASTLLRNIGLTIRHYNSGTLAWMRVTREWYEIPRIQLRHHGIEQRACYRICMLP